MSTSFPVTAQFDDAMREEFGSNPFENGATFLRLLNALRAEGLYREEVDALDAALRFVPGADPAVSTTIVGAWLRHYFPDVLDDFDTEDSEAFIEGVESAV